MIDLFHVSVNALSGLSHTFKLIFSTSENILNNFNVAV